LGDAEKAKKLFTSRDKDKDGKLSFGEFASGKKAAKPAADAASSPSAQ
jgi:Ca2+-binding EF-hand superfamily protein